MKLLFDVYKVALAAELEKFYTAFVHKHHIFPASPSESKNDGPGMSPKEAMAMKNLMAGIDDVTVQQRLTTGGAA